MQIIIATDAWEPQINGVVRTYQRVHEELQAQGHDLEFITPQNFKTVPCPTYREIRLSLVFAAQMKKHLQVSKPDVVHIATEGPIGWAMRSACLQMKTPFTTAYHTRFPEYIAKRFPLPVSLLYRIVRRFHSKSGGTMVATKSLKKELFERGFSNLLDWSRGVDTTLFHPQSCRLFGDDKVSLYVGRVAIEKNLESFLSLEFNGKKVVVGDGPSLPDLKEKYKDVIFTGAKMGKELAQCYSSADVFVFPSLTDTYGIVMLEAMASGLPVAAYPVTGPIDVVSEGRTGALDEDLGRAVSKALTLDREKCRKQALKYSWAQCAELFIQNLEHSIAHNKITKANSLRAEV